MLHVIEKKVRARREFRVGPKRMNIIAVAKGDMCTVYSENQTHITVTTPTGSIFCHSIKTDWEVVK